MNIDEKCYNFLSDDESHINGFELSDLSDAFDDNDDEDNGRPAGLSEKATLLSLDDVSYSRDLRLINVAVDRRPKLTVISRENRIVKEIQAIVHIDDTQLKAMDNRQIDMDSRKKRHDIQSASSRSRRSNHKEIIADFNRTEIAGANNQRGSEMVDAAGSRLWSRELERSGLSTRGGGTVVSVEGNTYSGRSSKAKQHSNSTGRVKNVDIGKAHAMPPPSPPPVGVRIEKVQAPRHLHHGNAMPVAPTFGGANSQRGLPAYDTTNAHSAHVSRTFSGNGADFASKALPQVAAALAISPSRLQVSSSSALNANAFEFIPSFQKH
jgi:hypothetical protein